MKLIDKDEALKSLEIKARSITFGDTFERACLKGVCHSYNAINELPIIDAIPILWIEEWLKKMPKHTTPYFYKRYGEVYKAVVLNLVKDWRKENE